MENPVLSMRWLKSLVSAGFLAALLTVMSPGDAQARCCVCDMTDDNMSEANRIVDEVSDHVTDEHDTTRQQIADFENRLIEWFDDWWDEQFRPSLEDLGEHWSTQILENARMLGTFFDAQNQIFVQNKLQQEMLKAGQRNEPHDYGCVAGTLSTGLTRAMQAEKAMRMALNIDANARNMHHVEGGNQFDFSMTQDSIWRWETFIDHFCDPMQNTLHLPGRPPSGAPGDPGWPAPAIETCGNGGALGWTIPNGDLMIGQQLLDNETLDTEEELRTVHFMSMQLIDPKILNPIPYTALEGSTGKGALFERRTNYARRFISKDMINSIIARRIPGSQAPTEVRDLLLQSGVPVNQIPANWNPSYHEMMTLITKRRFWDPSYFVRLQNSPENAVRERAILSAFALMQERDFYELQERLNLMMANILVAHYED